jgi:RNA polymerase sigma factor (sigma-70 family)
LDAQSQEPVVRSGAAEAHELPSFDVAALTRQMVAGNEQAYRRFYEAYFDRLSRYLLVVTQGHEEAAVEALQGALVRVVRHIRVFSEESVFWGWLTVVARSALADQTRKRQRYLAFLDRLTERWRIERALAEPGPAERDLLALLDQHLAGLSSEERDLLERKYFEREPVQQIANELQTTEKAIESRLVRVRRKLKAALLESLKIE